MEFDRWMPQVCSAVDSAKFAREAGVSLIDRQGSACGESVIWTFKLDQMRAHARKGDVR
jgi:hypothetical protein